MRNRRLLHGMLVVGIGTLAFSCGPAPETPDPTKEKPSPTSTVAESPPLPATATLTPAVTRTPERTCPPLTGKASAIQVQADPADYSKEIADYLNSGGSLEELQIGLASIGDSARETKVAVLSVDVTGDGQLEVVVESLWIPPGRPLSGYAYVFTCAAGRYVAHVVADFGFTASFADALQNQTLGLRSVEDVTGDGVPELLLSFVESPEMLPILLPDSFVRFFKIVGWDGKDFVELLPERLPGRPAVTAYRGDGALSDADGDGLKELIVGSGAPLPGYGHPFLRAKTETWGWAGSGFALRCATLSAPTYRFQAVEDGDAAMLCGDLDEALASYQRAIFDESLKTWVGDELGLVPAPEDERSLIGAYSRYRIMLIHLASGADDAASTVYDTLTKSFPPGSMGHSYAELAASVWEEYKTSEDLPTACGKAIRFAATERLAPLADSYEYYSEMYATPEYLCPF